MTTLALVAMIAALLPALVIAATPAGAETPTELFISEYIEGGSFNKAIEIYNGTGGPIDLLADTYTLELYSNGSNTVSKSLALSGTIADGDVYVLAHEQANAAILAQADYADSPNNVINFNGDDGVVLRKGGAIVDAFGQFDEDPGSQWPGGGQNGTLVRKATVCAGDTDFTDAFDASVEWNLFAQDTVTELGTHTADCNGVGGPADPVINEFVANHTGSDTEAFVEILGDPTTDYSAFTVLEIEGEPTSSNPGQPGTIDAVLTVGTTDAGGYWLNDEDMENGTLTILLVENFSGSKGDDLDSNEDGTFDGTPWDRIVDAVAVSDGGGSDLTYAATVLAPFFDSAPFTPGGASRIPNGTDTDAVADWVRNDFSGFGFAGFPGSPALGEAVNTPGAVNATITVITDPIGVCGDPATLIHDIQGTDLASTDVGNIREIEGVVVGDFQGTTGLGGFNLQEETGDQDLNPLSSEGIFVFDDTFGVDVSPGQIVRVRGSVAEFNGLTEINNVEAVLDCNQTAGLTLATVTLPVADVEDLEAFEGMLVNIPQTLYVSGNFTQARFGEVDLSVDRPLDNPTNVAAPGAAANAVADLNARSRIQLDDGSTVQNPLPLPPYLVDGTTLRTGDTLDEVTAVLGYSFGAYELHPTVAPVFERENVRPTGPPDVGGSLTVAAYNVLNYFTTLDYPSGDPRDNMCGPSQNQGCRGADSAFEFDRQRAKLVAAISKLDADVVGLMEIENHPGDVPTADLVAGLNAAMTPGTYDYIATGAIGTDAIRQAIIYKPASVAPVGSFAVLDSSVDPTFNDDKNRPVLAQTFESTATAARFTVAVNHLKSKGSDCDSIGDPDIGDGQGNCNQTRTTAAAALVNWLAGDPTGSGDDDVLIIGDLNAYAEEDPVTTIEAAGYEDLIETFVGSGYSAGAYSFNFRSESGYLDHGLANASMAEQVTDADFWHVNADEPSGLDYNSFNQPGLYQPDEFRSSDHDPVVIGLELYTAKDLKTQALPALAALLPGADKATKRRVNNAIARVGDSLNEDWWVEGSGSEITTHKVFDQERRAIVQLELVVASGVDQAAAAQAVIDELVEADRMLAQVAIYAAIAGDGDPFYIAAALDYVAMAAADIAAGLYNEAVNNYKEAWKLAIEALE
ncbi:MAG: ExeM/NucH family extracellular endonuclease [Acidimicrobiia bacterium]|nr:ExeM/NucH family extracellular endonuclease [Acidimicrobiia bacterium]